MDSSLQFTLEKILGTFAWGKNTDGKQWSFIEMADYAERLI